MKERLTGAIILVALLVLLVPELLSGPNPSAATAVAPSADGQPMRSYTIDLGDDATSRRSVAAVATPAPSPTVPESSPPSAASTDAQAGETAVEGASSAPAPVASPRPMVSSTAGTRAPATSAAASVEVPPTAPPARPAAVAPRPSAPSARVAPPPESRVATAAPERRSGSGWAVQVGSFASRENAERLARELKGKGFDSHVSESSGSGKRLWRVRVGPEPDRASAVALGARLRATGQTGGSVVPMP